MPHISTHYYTDKYTPSAPHTLTKHLDGLPVAAVPALHPVHPPPLPPPEFAADQSVQHSQAEDRQQEEPAGDPDHGAQQTCTCAVLRRLTLTCLPPVSTILVLDTHQHKHGSGAAQSHSPEAEDESTYATLGHCHFGPEWEADGKISLCTQCRHIQYGGVGAALADELEKLAQDIPQQPWPVAPHPVQVQRKAQEDQQVRERHAGQVQVGRGAHLFILQHHHDGGQITHHSRQEEEHTGDCYTNEDRDGENGDRGHRNIKVSVSIPTAV